MESPVPYRNRAFYFIRLNWLLFVEFANGRYCFINLLDK